MKTVAFLPLWPMKGWSPQVGWNVILCRLSSTKTVRLPEHKKYIERKVSQHLGGVEIAEKRKSLPRLSSSAFRGNVSPP